MTDSKYEEILEESKETLDYLDQTNNGGLQKAAEAKFCKNCGLIETVIPRQNFTKKDKQPCEDNVMEDITLYRGKDVKALIIEKIEQAEEKVEKYNGFDRLNLNDAKARKQELESLLEELEQ